MTTSWPNDTGTPETGDRPGEPLPKRVPGREYPPPQAPAAPVNMHDRRATTTAPAGDPARGQVQYWAQRANIKSCWMCGIRMPADQMVADGGSACSDLRWYCLDTWGCTERWTSRSARLVAIRPGAAETPKQRDGQGTGAGTAQPVPA